MNSFELIPSVGYKKSSDIELEGFLPQSAMKGKRKGRNRKTPTELKPKDKEVCKTAQDIINAHKKEALPLTPIVREQANPIDRRRKDPQLVDAAAIKSIRFSQKTITPTNVNQKTNLDTTIDDLATSMFEEYKGEPIKVVKFPGNIYVSYDNRRLVAAKKIAEIDRTYGILIKLFDLNSQVGRNLQKRLAGQNTGNAQNGFVAFPKIRQDGKEYDKTIAIAISSFDLTRLNPADQANINARKDKIDGSIHI